MNQNNNSFIRWQNYSINQFIFTNNLCIGLSSGILAIFFTMVLNKTIVFNITGKRLLATIFVFIFLSLASGVATALCRLLDFKVTAKVARKRDEGDKNGIKELRQEYRKLGKCSWWLFTAQMAFFILGSLFILILGISLIFS